MTQIIKSAVNIEQKDIPKEMVTISLPEQSGSRLEIPIPAKSLMRQDSSYLENSFNDRSFMIKSMDRQSSFFNNESIRSLSLLRRREGPLTEEEEPPVEPLRANPDETLSGENI